MQGIQNFYLPFKPLLEAANPGLAARVDDAFSSAFTSVAPYAPAGENGQISYQPYSDVTVVQRAPIQRAGYDLASVLRQVRALLLRLAACLLDCFPAQVLESNFVSSCQPLRCQLLNLSAVPVAACCSTSCCLLAADMIDWQAAEALGVKLEPEEEDEECEPKQEVADIAASDPQIQNGLNYFRYALHPVPMARMMGCVLFGWCQLLLQCIALH